MTAPAVQTPAPAPLLTPRGRYVNLRCKCGHRLRARLECVSRTETRLDGRTALVSEGGWWSVACSKCPRSMLGKAIRGRTRPEIRCGPRCTGAVGHTCDCACGGKNHGRDYGE